MKSMAGSIKGNDFFKKILGLILLAPLAFIISSAAIGSNNYLLLFLIAGIIFLTVLTDFRISLALITLTSFFISFSIYQFHLPKSLFSLPYFLIILVLIRETFFAANLRIVSTPINYLLSSVIALGFLSIAHGDASLAAAFKALLRHVGFPLLFILILTAEPDEKLMRRLVWAILLVALLQIPVSAWQFFYYTFINHKDHGFRADHSCGIIGVSCGGHTAILMAMTYCIVLAAWLVKGFTWKRGLVAAAMILPVFLASARAGVIYFAIASVFMIGFAPLKKHIGYAQRFLLGGLIVAGMLGVITSGIGGEDFRNVLDINYIYDYSNKQADSGMGRLQTFTVVGQKLNSPVSKMIGLGLGMLTPTEFIENKKSLIAEDTDLYRNMTGYAFTTLELGYLGLILFIMLHFQLYRSARRVLRQIDDPFWEAVSLGFCGTTIVYTLSSLYVDSWIYYPIAFSFWALGAAVYRIGVIKGIFRT